MNRGTNEKTTFQLLVEKYQGRPYVKVEEVIPEYFGIKRVPEIRREMRSGSLGLRPVILRRQMHVDLKELAEVLDGGRN